MWHGVIFCPGYVRPLPASILVQQVDEGDYFGALILLVCVVPASAWGGWGTQGAVVVLGWWCVLVGVIHVYLVVRFRFQL